MSRRFIFTRISDQNDIGNNRVVVKCSVDLPNGTRLVLNITQTSKDTTSNKSDSVESNCNSKIIHSHVLDDQSIVYFLLSDHPSNDKNVVQSEPLPDGSYLIVKYQE